MFFQLEDSLIFWFWEMFLGMNFKISSPLHFLPILLVCVWASWACTLDAISFFLLASAFCFICTTLWSVSHFHLPVLFAWTTNFPFFLIVSLLRLSAQHPHLVFTASPLTPLMLFLPSLFHASWELPSAPLPLPPSPSPSPSSPVPLLLPLPSPSLSYCILGFPLDTEDFTMWLGGAGSSSHALCFFLKVWLFSFPHLIVTKD